MMRLIIKLGLVALFIFSGAAGARAGDPVPVFVSILPQKYFVQQIGKDLVDVRVMVQPGASPATYEPSPRQMAALSRARLYFAVGVPFEAVWLERIAAANPAMRVVHTEAGIVKMPMTVAHDHAADADAHGDDHHHADDDHGADADTHGDEDHHADHDHGIADPHIWLAPSLVKVQSGVIAAALQDLDPAHSDTYAANLAAFLDAIDRLDADLKAILAGSRGGAFMVFHPAWGYFARDYGLHQVPIEIEGKEPKPGQLKTLIARAREKGIAVVFVQPQFSRQSAAVVAREIGGRVVAVDPLTEEWVVNLRTVAAAFRAALK